MRALDSVVRHTVLAEKQTAMNQQAPWILLVDDDPEHNQALARILDRAGYHVHATGSAGAALGLLAEHQFDLVITDLLMPGQGGLDLLRSARAMRPEVPVIVVTGFGEWASYVEAMNSGAVDYLSKPLRREDILAKVREALARHGVGRSTDTQSEPEAINGAAA